MPICQFFKVPLEKHMENFEKCVDVMWMSIRQTAAETAKSEPVLAGLLDEVILSRKSLFDSICMRVARKLSRHALGTVEIYEVFMEAFEDREIRQKAFDDLMAIKSRDPACSSYMHPIMSTAWRIGCGTTTGGTWRSTSRACAARFSPWTSIRRPDSDRAYCSTMRRPSWRAKRA